MPFAATWRDLEIIILREVSQTEKDKDGFPGGSDGKASVCNAGDPGSIPGLGRSPGEGNGNPLQYSCLENPTDRGAWWTTVHGVAESRTLPPLLKHLIPIPTSQVRKLELRERK